MRKFLLVVLVLAVLLAAALAAFIVLAPRVLDSQAFRGLVENSVRSLTGFSCRIGGIRFDYPFSVTAHGVSLEGQTGGTVFSLYAGRARIVSEPGSLVLGRVDEIQVRDVEVHVHVDMAGGAFTAGGEESLAHRPFEVPGWAFRVGRAGIRSSTARVSSEAGSVCFEDLGITWACGAGERAGTLRVSLSPGGEQTADLVLRLAPASIEVLSGPVVLPALDVAAVTALAGLEAPLAGTLSGAVFPVPGDSGSEALHLVMFSEDLALGGGEASRTGFDQARVRLGGTVLMPRNGSGFAAFVEEATASFEGLTMAGRPAGTALEPLDLTATFAYDTLTDTADWTVGGRDRKDHVGLRGEGTLEGLRSGRRHAEASLRAECSDLAGLTKDLGKGGSLPEGLTLQGGVLATAALTGPIDSADLRGSLETSSLRVGLNPALPLVPVRLDASFSGSFRQGTPEGLRLETTRWEIGRIASPKASFSLGETGFAGEVTIDSADARELASFLAPVLPREVAGYEWGGTLALSATARTLAGPGPFAEGRFAAQLRDGRFASADYQRMGEGVDGAVDGTFHLPGSVPETVGLSVDASLSRGEIVIGEVYGDLAKTRPRLQAGLAVEPETRALSVPSAVLTLDGVGTAALTGNLSLNPAGARGRLEIEAGPLDLEALLDRVLRDGLGGRYPAVEGVTGAGTLAIHTELNLEDGSSRLRGNLALEGASLADPSQGLTAGRIEVSLPFSLFSLAGRPQGRAGPGAAPGRPTPAGTLTVEEIDFKGLEIPRVHARVLLAENRLTLQEPVRVDFAGGAVHIDDLVLEVPGAGRHRGRASLEVTGLELAPVARALAGKAFEGRLNGRFDRLAIEDGAWEAEGRLGLWIRGGELRVEEIELAGRTSGLPSGRFTVHASAIPLEPLSREFVEPLLKGTLEGALPSVEISGGKVHTTGSLTLSAMGGEITLSELQAGDLEGSNPFVRMDIRMKEIDLAELTSPLEIGRISGVLQGRIRNLEVRPGFPYATAFEASLETVRRRGVPRKIDAKAVDTISRIGGSNQLAAALSRGLYQYFDEYYYRKMGLRASLQDGWLELHGIRKGEQEYLITRAFRIPTLSMPITVLTPNQKIQFNRWVDDLTRLGQGRD